MRVGLFFVSCGLLGFVVHSVCAKAIETVQDRSEDHPILTKPRAARGVDPREETVDWILPEDETDYQDEIKSSEESRPWFAEDETFALFQRNTKNGRKSRGVDPREETIDWTLPDSATELPDESESSEESRPWFAEDETFAVFQRNTKIGRKSRGVDPREETIDWTLPDSVTELPDESESSEESRPWFAEDETFAFSVRRTKRNCIVGTNEDRDVLSRSPDLPPPEEGNNNGNAPNDIDNSPNNNVNELNDRVNTNIDEDSSRIVFPPSDEVQDTVFDFYNNMKDMQNAGLDRGNAVTGLLGPPKNGTSEKMNDKDRHSGIAESVTSGEVDNNGNALNNNANSPDTNINGSGNSVNAKADEDSSKIAFPPSDEVQDTVFDFYNNMKDMQNAGLDRGNAVTGLVGPPKTGVAENANVGSPIN